MVSATLQKADSDKTTTRDEFISGIIAAMLAGNWKKVSEISQRGITETTKAFDDGSQEYEDAVNSASLDLANNASYYVGKRNDLKGNTLKKYLGLVATAELQLATANVVKTVATGRIERVTHPERSKTGVCPRCKELEGLHDFDEDDLYWSHPNCECEWRPETVTVSAYANLTDDHQNKNLTSKDSETIIGRGKDMDKVKFKNYSREQREAFVKKGWALADEKSGGAFPVADKGDLEDALHRIGTTNHPRAQVVAFLRRRAKELGAEDMLGEKTAPPASHGVTVQLKDTAVFSNRQVTRDGMVVRRGKVFEAGSRLDMHGIPFVTTQEDLNHMVMNFKPFPVGIGHPEAPSPLDGHLGMVTNLFIGRNPNDLWAEAHIPSFVNEVLESKDEGRVSMVFNRHTKEPLSLDFVSDPNVVDAALMASFARTKHNTPDGQKFMQTVHDACSKRGAVCKQDKSKHASRHELSAIQQFHDISAQHGAKCAESAEFANNTKGHTMNWKAFFSGAIKAAEEHDKTKMAGDDPAHDFEANWQEEQTGALGEESSVDIPDDYEANWNEDEDGDADGDYDGSDVSEDEEQGADFHPAPLTEANPMTSQNAQPTETREDAKFATVLKRNIQLEAELARERAHRIESEAVAFADAEISGLRSLPAEREMLIELYRQASSDDAAIGEVKMADDKTTSRCERLKALFSTRQEHWMTKEMLSTSLSPEVVAMAVKTAEASVAGVPPMDAKRKDELMGMTNLGKSAKKATA